MQATKVADFFSNLNAAALLKSDYNRCCLPSSSLSALHLRGANLAGGKCTRRRGRWRLGKSCPAPSLWWYQSLFPYLDWRWPQMMIEKRMAQM